MLYALPPGVSALPDSTDQENEIILELFAYYREAAGLPELSRDARVRLLAAAAAEAPPAPAPEPAGKVIPFPTDRVRRSQHTP